MTRRLAIVRAAAAPHWLAVSRPRAEHAHHWRTQQHSLAWIWIYSRASGIGPDDGRVVGSALMSGRDALDGPLLRLAMIAYNVVQVGLCGYMTAETAWQYVLLEYRPICNNELVLLPGQPFLPTGMSNVLWVFYLSKVLDFCDTAFIVLRKKDRQLSFLHVFHHTSIFLVYYLQTLIAYNGDGFLAVILNSFVHLVMYSYYGLIAAFPG